jgi:hypothetical protein
VNALIVLEKKDEMEKEGSRRNGRGRENRVLAIDTLADPGNQASIRSRRLSSQRTRSQRRDSGALLWVPVEFAPRLGHSVPSLKRNSQI